MRFRHAKWVRQYMFFRHFLSLWLINPQEAANIHAKLSDYFATPSFCCPLKGLRPMYIVFKEGSVDRNLMVTFSVDRNLTAPFSKKKLVQSLIEHRLALMTSLWPLIQVDRNSTAPSFFPYVDINISSGVWSSLERGF